jgi:Rrf2 family protein
LRFHRDVEYALIALSEMAKNPRIFSARELAGAQDIPYGLLSKILQRLSGSGILESTQGPRGGYRPTGKLDEISLSEIMESVHGETHVAPCVDESACVRIDNCTIRPGVLKVQSMWDTLVTGMTLGEFFSIDKNTAVTAAAEEG